MKKKAKKKRLSPYGQYFAGWSDYYDSWDRAYYHRHARRIIKDNALNVAVDLSTPYSGHKGLGFFGDKKSLVKLLRELHKDGFPIGVRDIHRVRY